MAAGVLALALAEGAADITARSVAAILVLWTILLAVGFNVWPRERPPRAALVTGGLLLAFTAFTGLSMLWAPAAEPAFGELDRAAFYAALFALPVLAGRYGDATRWADGLAAAIGVVALLAVTQRLLPGVLPEGDIGTLLPAAATRLSYPVGYWNALAILLGLGIPLLLRLAASDGGLAVRALAVAPLPALGVAMYLTSSRGGVAVATVGTVVFLALAPRRFRTIQALAVAGLGAAVAISVVRSHPALVDGLPGSPAAEDEGPGVFATVLLVCAAAGGAHALLSGLLPTRLALPRAAAVGAAVLVAVAAVAGAAAADPAERLRTFKQAPPATSPDNTQDHLVSSAGSGRWQFWEAALDQFAEHPLRGEGAATYEAWWARYGTIDWFVRNAHSLWLETLGALGIIGLLLLAGAFVAGLVAGASRLRGPDEHRSAVAALLAVACGFVVGAGIDWIWQVPAVAAVGVVALGVLAGPATRLAGREAAGRPLRLGPRVAVAAAAWVAIVAQGIPLLATGEVRSSQRAAERGDLREAQERAVAARAIQPWAASPHVQLALVREQLGDVQGARGHAADAIERDRTDWRLRIVAARLATKAGDGRAAREALREARRLNPRSPALRPPS